MNYIKNPKNSAPNESFLQGTAFIELYVGNAKQAAYYYQHAFGFNVVAYAGPETGIRDRASYVLEQGKVKLVLTSGLNSSSEVSKHVLMHGDGVKNIALSVDNVEKAFEVTTNRGAKPVAEPNSLKDSNGVVRVASIATYGDTIHSFIDSKDYGGVHLPGYNLLQGYAPNNPAVGLRFIDHAVGNVEKGKMDTWADFYKEIFGFHVFQEFDENDIATQYSALKSKVARDNKTMITFPINEPAEGKKLSQIQEYLDYYQGAGVQHIAMHTNNIIETVQIMKTRGVEFLSAPKSYYQNLKNNGFKHPIEEDFEKLEYYNILADFDEDGYLLQIFTKPVADRPTLFFEVIQRHGCQGFGKGNFKALFEAIEAEQAKRGNL